MSIAISSDGAQVQPGPSSESVDRVQALTEQLRALEASIAQLNTVIQAHAEDNTTLKQEMSNLRQKFDGPPVLHEPVSEPVDRVQSLTEELHGLRASIQAQADENTALKQEVRILTQKAEDKMKQPNHPPRRPRNLVVCIDGTSNQFSEKNTNVVELYHRLIRDENQLTFYNSGIGTYATPSWKSPKYYRQVIMNKLDLAFALNFDVILLSAYRWLSENYQEGDVIYLFRFSRGAYQIRTLSAMIDSVGLLRKGNLDQIPFAYELYAETKKIGNTSEMCKHFKATFSEKDVQVYFAGAWDTVSSVGLVRNKTLPGTTDGMLHVTFFRHALALHERRIKFLQENVRGGLGPDMAQSSTKDGPPHTKEVWFAGAHGDIGGGRVLNMNMDQFGPALRWMLTEARTAGLRLTDTPQTWEDKELVVHNSLTGIWNLFEYMPFTRLSYKGPKDLTSWPHFGRARGIQLGQKIHVTALNSQETWRALLPSGSEMRWDSLPDDMIEADPYAGAKDLIERIRRHLDLSTGLLDYQSIYQLRLFISTDVGVQSLRDSPGAENTLMAIVGRYSKHADNPAAVEAFNTVTDAALRVLDLEGAENRVDNFGLYRPDQVGALMRRAALQDAKLAERVEILFVPAQVQAPLKHPRGVLCVSYMPDGKRIVSGCFDGAVRIWNLQTGQILGAPMTGHTGSVWSVAVSADGTQIASASMDKTVRVWTAATGTMVALLEGHREEVDSVAFSPDGTRVASGSYDKTIRVWDVATAKTVVGPIQGHRAWIPSVAYSPDGTHIASGAYGGAVCVWNAETGENVWQTETSERIYSVAYSPDGRQIVAGCWDSAVPVLDAETGEIVLGPLTGHTGDVNSVAFSPDGKEIASASDDYTVRLWDAETGAELGVLRGHRNWVRSVAFSPDGKHVASASFDNTVRIWDATGEWKRR